MAGRKAGRAEAATAKAFLAGASASASAERVATRGFGFHCLFSPETSPLSEDFNRAIVEQMTIQLNGRSCGCASISGSAQIS